MNGNFHCPGMKTSRGNWVYSNFFAPLCFLELEVGRRAVLIKHTHTHNFILQFYTVVLFLLNMKGRKSKKALSCLGCKSEAVIAIPYGGCE